MRNKKACIPDQSKFVTNPGEDKHITYDPIVNADGTVSLKESGSFSMRQMINSFADQCDINFILQRLEVGDTSVLNRAQGMFGDFTDMPKTYAEALQLHIDAERTFEKLPSDVKLKFDNNFNKWFMSAGSEDWISKMKIDNKVDEVIKNDEE